jgi:hypothetical protein
MTREDKNAYQREWVKKNKDKKRESDRRYRESHREQIKKMHSDWRERNREHVNEKSRENYYKNPEAHKKRVERYKESHKEQIKEANKKYRIENKDKRTEYETNRRKNNPKHRFRSSFISLIRHYLRKHGYNRKKTTWEIVGCDFESFLEHIVNQFEEGMTLENYGHHNGCWNIDHIIPISTAKTDDDLERLNHYTNLQPMWATENFHKSNKTS